MKVLSTLLVLVCVACSGPDDPGALMDCGPGGQCDPGYECHPADNKCYLTMTTPDAASPDGLAIDARPDAGKTDDAHAAPPPDAHAAPDALPPDASPADSIPPDAPTADIDALPPDASPPDSIPPDAPTADIDASPPDSIPPDAPPPDIDAPPVPPETTLDVTPAALSPIASATFVFHASIAGSTFECSLDGVGFAPCHSGLTVGPLGDGSHTMAVFAVAPSGAKDLSPVSWTWTIDTVPPDTSITAGPVGTVADPRASFSFAASEPASFQCSLDAGAYADCSSPASTGGLADGSHTFRVRAIDAAGNTDPAPASRTWTIDATGPVVNIVSPAVNGRTGANGTVQFGSEAGAHDFQCQLDAQPGYAPCSAASGYPFSALSEGPHAIAIHATDANGIVGSDTTRTWTVDTTGPTVIVDRVIPTTGGTALVDLHSPDADAHTFSCAIDANPFSDCTGKNPLYLDLAPGLHTFHAYAVDDLLNQGPTTSADVDIVLGDGHVVLIGDDFDEPVPATERLIANAVELSGASHFARPVRVIGWTNPDGTVDPTEHDNALAAIDAGVTAAGLHAWSHQGDFSDPADLAEALAGNDVLLVYHQARLGSYLVDVAQMWQPILTDFLAHGGVIIVYDGFVPVDSIGPVPGGTNLILGTLLQVTMAHLVPFDVPGNTTISSTDPVAVGVPAYTPPTGATQVFEISPTPPGYSEVVSFDYMYQQMVVHVDFAN